MTETRPEAVGRRTPQAVAPAGADTWLTTGDHKRIGLMLIFGGLAAIVAGLVGAATTAMAQTAARGDGIEIWTGRSELASANVAMLLVIGLPALWLGLASFVVPLQIGSTRLALPRMLLLSLWSFVAGGVIVAVGYAIGPVSINFGDSVAAAAVSGSSATSATELVVVGTAVVALATLLGAVAILVTILSQRAAAMTFARLPAFTWSALATSTALVLATPVFLSGLALLYVDQHYGGVLFSARSRGGLKLWQHNLWMFGRPEAFLLAAPALGVICEVVATSVRRPLVGFPSARSAAVAAALLSLLAWAAGVSALHSPVAPTATITTTVIALPVGLLALCWLATLRVGRPHFQPSLLFAFGFVSVVGLAAVAGIVAGAVGVEGPDATAFRNGQVTMLVLGAPLLGAAAALHHWAPKLWGRALPVGLGLLQFLLLFGGTVLAALPGYVVGLGGDDGIAPVGAAGSAMAGLGVLLFAAALGRRSGSSPAGTTRGGLTLEWATSSPPPAHNFDRLPEVRSAYPLFDTDGGPQAARVEAG